MNKYKSSEFFIYTFDVNFLNMFKTFFQNNMQSIIESNQERYGKLKVSLKNAVTQERKQKIRSELSKLNNYINKLEKIHNKLFNKKSADISNLQTNSNEMSTFVVRHAASDGQEPILFV